MVNAELCRETQAQRMFVPNLSGQQDRIRLGLKHKRNPSKAGDERNDSNLCARPRKLLKLISSTITTPAELPAPDSPCGPLLSIATSTVCSLPRVKSETGNVPDCSPPLPLRDLRTHEPNCIPILQEPQSEEDGHPLDCDDRPSQIIKARIVRHPLYPRLLEAHAACLRECIPPDLDVVEDQLSVKAEVADKYRGLIQEDDDSEPEHSIDQFMAYYITMLEEFCEQLHQHMKQHVVGAIEGFQSLIDEFSSLTSLEVDIESGVLQSSNIQVTQLEKNHEELKNELKQKFKSKLLGVRAEILRKRQVGKHPWCKTTILKNWWRAHSTWPYPKTCCVWRIIMDGERMDGLLWMLNNCGRVCWFADMWWICYCTWSLERC